jgi:hypothetical protein
MQEEVKKKFDTRGFLDSFTSQAYHVKMGKQLASSALWRMTGSEYQFLSSESNVLRCEQPHAVHRSDTLLLFTRLGSFFHFGPEQSAILMGEGSTRHKPAEGRTQSAISSAARIT